MDAGISYENAISLLHEYNADDFHLEHANILEKTMRYFAKELGYGEDAEFWGIVGLLHDIDFEKWPNEHCTKAKELLEKAGASAELIHAVQSHGFGICSSVEPQHEMEKILFATDELTGLIGATALMRPSKSVQDMEVKSVMKKFKTPKFAAGCSRETIQKGADILGWSLEELIQKTLDALKTFEK